MKIPAFKASKHFLGDTDLPCLAAKINNSRLPGVATRCIAESKRNPTCEIYLRGRNPKQVSAWQRTILAQLFEREGLAAAIEEAMREHEKSGRAYAFASERERKLIHKEGVAPFITISTIVIDEVVKQVIFSGGTLVDSHFAEHGISIYLRKGRWHVDDGDYFDNYRFLFGMDYADRQEQLQAEERQKKWDALFPPPGPKTPVKKNCSFLYGRWELDERETNKLLKKLGREAITGIGQFHVISETELESFLSLGRSRIFGFERRGNWVKVMAKNRTLEFWYDGKLLVEMGGLVFRQQDPWGDLFPAKRGATVVSAPRFLDGEWRFDACKTTEVLKRMGAKKDEVEEEIESQEELEPLGYRFSPGTRQLISCGEVAGDDDLLGCERRGNRVTLRHRMKGGEMVLTEECWCDGEYLVERNGLAYRRVTSKKS